MAKFIGHQSCPKCGSSDALATYDDGGVHCFSVGCNHHINGTTGMMTTPTENIGNNKPLDMGGTVAAIPERRISKETCAKYGVTVEYSPSGEIVKHFYPYYNQDTLEVTSAKVRDVKTKTFTATVQLRT